MTFLHSILPLCVVLHNISSLIRVQKVTECVEWKNKCVKEFGSSLKNDICCQNVFMLKCRCCVCVYGASLLCAAPPPAGRGRWAVTRLRHHFRLQNKMGGAKAWQQSGCLLPPLPAKGRTASDSNDISAAIKFWIKRRSTEELNVGAVTLQMSPWRRRRTNFSSLCPSWKVRLQPA